MQMAGYSVRGRLWGRGEGQKMIELDEEQEDLLKQIVDNFKNAP